MCRGEILIPSKNWDLKTPSSVSSSFWDVPAGGSAPKSCSGLSRGGTAGDRRDHHPHQEQMRNDLSDKTPIIETKGIVRFILSVAVSDSMSHGGSVCALQLSRIMAFLGRWEWILLVLLQVALR